MHELSVASAVVETAIRHADGRRITVVHLTLGTLRQVVPDSLSFYFDIVGRDTTCEGARLEIEPVDALMGCRACGQEWDPAPPPEHDVVPGASIGSGLLLPQFRCPACEAAGAIVVRGDELMVDSIDVEDQDADQDEDLDGAPEPARAGVNFN